MRCKKLTLKQMFSLYSKLKPYIKWETSSDKVIEEAINDGIGKDICRMFYEEKYIPDNEVIQDIMISDAFENNNVAGFIFFMLEITNG